MNLLQRQKLGVLEQASSVENNIELVLGKDYKLVNIKKISKLLHKLEPLSQSLKALQKGSGSRAEECHVVHVLSNFLKTIKIL